MSEFLCIFVSVRALVRVYTFVSSSLRYTSRWPLLLSRAPSLSLSLYRVRFLNMLCSSLSLLVYGHLARACSFSLLLFCACFLTLLSSSLCVGVWSSCRHTRINTTNSHSHTCTRTHITHTCTRTHITHTCISDAHTPGWDCMATDNECNQP